MSNSFCDTDGESANYVSRKPHLQNPSKEGKMTLKEQIAELETQLQESRHAHDTDVQRAEGLLKNACADIKRLSKDHRKLKAYACSLQDDLDNTIDQLNLANATIADLAKALDDLRKAYNSLAKI